MFCFFFFSFICKIASIKVKYLFQNSWYDSYVVSKVMSFKIKASQNFSNQLYVVFFFYLKYITKILTDHFDKSTMSNVHCPCMCFVSESLLKQDIFGKFFTTFKNQSTTTLLKHIYETIENRYIIRKSLKRKKKCMIE